MIISPRKRASRRGGVKRKSKIGTDIEYRGIETEKNFQSIPMRNKKNETVTLKKGLKDVQLDYADLRKAVLVLRAVNHKLRQRIIDLLEDGETMTVTDIYIKLRLEQSVASQHLAILRRAGVVATERQGKFIYYSLDKERLAQISVLVEELAG